MSGRIDLYPLKKKITEEYLDPKFAIPEEICLLVVMDNLSEELPEDSYRNTIQKVADTYEVRIEYFFVGGSDWNTLAGKANRCDGFIVLSKFDEQVRKILVKFLGSYPEKDLDCFLDSSKRKWFEDESYMPCTALAVYAAIKYITEEDYRVSTDSKWNSQVTIVSRSDTLGLPLSLLLLEHSDFAVSVFHSKSKARASYFKDNSFLVCGAGDSDWTRLDDTYLEEELPDTIVINVGMHEKDGRMVGDFPEDVLEQNGTRYVPALGGIGPITVRILFAKLFTRAIDKICPTPY